MRTAPVALREPRRAMASRRECDGPRTYRPQRLRGPPSMHGGVIGQASDTTQCLSLICDSAASLLPSCPTGLYYPRRQSRGARFARQRRERHSDGVAKRAEVRFDVFTPRAGWLPPHFRSAAVRGGYRACGPRCCHASADRSCRRADGQSRQGAPRRIGGYPLGGYVGDIPGPSRWGPSEVLEHWRLVVGMAERISPGERAQCRGVPRRGYMHSRWRCRHDPLHTIKRHGLDRPKRLRRRQCVTWHIVSVKHRLCRRW